ncbi:OprD family outer membrane porin [Cryomorphaceae bacterium 1068]|nr:OprD family outer membrane porin [Cryomorphaceae bacterium 1068]
MKRLILSILILISAVPMMAQHHQDHPSRVDSSRVREQIHSLREFFTHGHWGGHVRNYFMLTDHTGPFDTQYANAIGMRIDFRTARFKGFELGIGGIFSFDLFSSDLDVKDPIAGRYPAFELQLFDVQNPSNKHDLDRLEELFLAYHFGKSVVSYGRQVIETPFVNLTDGRMKPYAFQGLTMEFNEIKNTRINAMWITHVSPRSTVEWYSLEESVGISAEGFTPEGDTAHYHEHISSSGLAILGFEHKFNSHLKASGWYYHAHNLVSTFYGKIEGETPLSENVSIYGGIEAMLQDKIGEGGNEDEDHSYVSSGDRSKGIGGQAGIKYKGFDLSFNALTLNDQGRFLFPREWGRENFFATVSRGRIEGTGNGQLYDIRLKKDFSDRLSAKVDYVHYDGPGWDNYEYNKYGIADYDQLNLELCYHFHNWFEGLDIRLLYVHKQAQEDVPSEIVYYQSNYNHFNIITNFTF